MNALSGSINLTVIAGVAAITVIGCTAFCINQLRSAKAMALQKKKKKRKFVMPPWAVSRMKELEHPQMSEEELEALNKRKPPEEWNTVIFFPDLLQDHRSDGPTKQLLHFFQQARTSIHLCMYLCSYTILSDVIRDMYKKKGLLVQVISEYDTWTAHNNFGFKCLEKNDIEIRLNTNGYMMHNKFAIIDEEAVLTGSLNWTKQGVRNNNENVMVTTDPRIVSKYVKEFNKLWVACKSSKECRR